MDDEKIELLKLSDIDFSEGLNFRRTYEVGDLKISLREMGQEEPVFVHKEADGTYEGLRGFRRAKAMHELNEANSAKFEFVKAIILEGMTAKEKVEFRLDQGERRGLSRPEVALGIKKMLEEGFSDTRIKCKVYPLLVACGWSKAIENPSKDDFELHSQIQTRVKTAFGNAKLLSDIPENVFDQWARGEEGRLTDGEVKITFKLLEKVQKIRDLHGEVDFDEAIAGLHAEAEKVKGFSIKPLTKQKLIDLEEALESELSKAVIRACQGHKVPELAELDAKQAEKENN